MQSQQRALNNQPTTVYQGDDGYWGITNDFDRRQKEQQKKGRTIEPRTKTPDRETARGVEQQKIEEGRKAGNTANQQQNNSIDPARTDPKAKRMRQKGADHIKNESSKHQT